MLFVILPLKTSLVIIKLLNTSNYLKRRLGFINSVITNRKLLFGSNNIRKSLRILIRLFFAILKLRRFIPNLNLFGNLKRFIRLKTLNKLKVLL